MVKKLLALDDISFLQETVKRYPEAKMLAGAAESSPEGNQELKDTALAYQVFDEETPVHPTAIEADRTFLGLLLFKAVLNEDKTKFPKLSDEKWEDLVSLTNGIVQTDEDLELVLYALTAQDLGKTQALVDAYQSEFGRAAEDHDKLISQLTERRPDMFTGYQSLSSANKTAYLEGSAINVPQFVQGECLPVGLDDLWEIEPRSRVIRYITELYDLAGVTGHVINDKSIVLDDNTLWSYEAAMESLADHENDSLQAYSSYLTKRLNKCDVLVFDTMNEEKWMLGRLVAQTRSFTNENAQTILKVVDDLALKDQELHSEMAITGLSPDEPKGIMVYYAPSLLNNSIKAKGDFEAGLSVGLQAMANTYNAVRPNVSTGQGQVVVNVNKLAKLANSAPDRIVQPVSASSDHDNQTLTLDV